MSSELAAQDWPHWRGPGVLYGLSSSKKGQIVAVDAGTGAVKWATEGRAGDQGAILLTPAHVLVLTTAGSSCWSGDPRQNTTKSAATPSPTARRGRCLCCCPTD